MRLNVSTSGPLGLPMGPESVMYLVAGDARRVDLTLPAAGAARSRFITVRRIDDRGRVIVHTAGELMEGGKEIRDKSGDSNAIALETRWDWVTFVTDGSRWYVFANGK